MTYSIQCLLWNPHVGTKVTVNPTSPLPQDEGMSQGWKPDHRPAALTCPEYLEAHSSVSISPCSGYSALWTEGSHVQTAPLLHLRSLWRPGRVRAP